MLKKIFKTIKNILFSFLILYGFNMMSTPLGITIPINLITLFSLTLLGLPALFSFILIYLLVF